MSIQRRARHDLAGSSPADPLMPFLDIIFGTLGIFVIVFAIQTIQKQMDAQRLVPDLIIGCVSDEEDFLVAESDMSAFDQMSDSDTINLVRQRIAQNKQQVINIAFAFSAACMRGRAFWTREIRSFQKDEGSARIRLIERALSDAPNAFGSFLDGLVRKRVDG